ncbi:MAG: transketolase [Vulcanimicrobiaceae bacterium]
MSIQTVGEDVVLHLKERANAIRSDIIEMLVEAGSGHSAGPLGMADIFAALYFYILRHDPSNPMWEDRDRLILSNGHICPVRYAAMAQAGYFPHSELHTLRKFGSRLQGHPERTRLPALETTSGPLGAGLAQASGLGYAAKMDRKSWRVYCVVSDAEQECGLHWEAVFFAAKFSIDNLICIVDRNGIQIDGLTEHVMPLEPLHAKYRAFNWNVIECDGNDVTDFLGAVERAKDSDGKPCVIIAKTVPGKGVDFMENDYHWHGKPPSPEEARMALRELRTLRDKIESGT